MKYLSQRYYYFYYNIIILIMIQIFNIKNIISCILNIFGIKNNIICIMNIIIFTIIKSINIKNIIFYIINKYFIIYGAWAPVVVLGHPCSYVTFKLMLLRWVHPLIHVVVGLFVEIQLFLGSTCYVTQNNFGLLAMQCLKKTWILYIHVGSK
jgi:hypothetical protein